VSRLTALTYLQSFGNRFTDDGIARLKPLRLLERLYLEEETLTAKAFDIVDALPNLKHVGQQDVPLSNRQLHRLRRRFPGVAFNR
jgi:hypothetical protein